MTEQYVTLFDKNFLVFGLALHRSLMQTAGDFCLWVVCMDRETERLLREFKLPRMRVLSLSEVENEDLMRVKKGRSHGEYCWTMTPFTITAVFRSDPNISRVTYVDADVYFFRDPGILIREMESKSKHVLITEHAYDRRYDQTSISGRFCVQFNTFNRTAESEKVYQWWQQRCLEWCFNRAEDGKFGDQKYLDQWPSMFPDSVHILQAIDETLAPWNSIRLHREVRFPVMYHFHGLRFMSGKKVRAFDGYQISPHSQILYNEYLKTLGDILNNLSPGMLDLPVESPAKSLRQKIGRIWRRFTKRRMELILPAAG